MNSVGKSLEEISAKGIKSWEETDELHNCDPERTSTFPLLRKINKTKTDILEILPVHIDIFPLSQGQRALWLLYQNDPKSTLYHVALTFRIQSKVDVPALRGAFQELIDRHPSLRTTFSIHNGGPFQKVHRDQQVCFEQIDASNLTWEELNNQVIMSNQKPFNLKKGPLMRVGLFSHAQEEHILLLNMHHIIFDAWSSLILLDELRILYSAQKVGTSAFLMLPDKSYADYVQWQADMLSGLEGERLWSFWREKLAGDLPIINLPIDRPRPAVQSFQEATYPFELNEELAEKVKALSRSEGKTVYMTLLAAFYVLLFLYTGQEDILVGSMATGRSQTEFTRTVGYFANPVVLRQDLSGDPTFKMFLTQVHKTVSDALRHQDYPFSLLGEQLQPNYNFSHSPLLQIMFNLSELGEVVDMLVPDQKRSQVEWDDLELNLYKISQQEGRYDLELEMIKVGRSLQGAFNYNKNLFNKATIVEMTECFLCLVKGLIADPEQHLSELSLLKDVEQDRLFEDQNLKNPEVAMVFKDQ